MNNEQHSAFIDRWILPSWEG